MVTLTALSQNHYSLVKLTEVLLLRSWYFYTETLSIYVTDLPNENTVNSKNDQKALRAKIVPNSLASKIIYKSKTCHVIDFTYNTVFSTTIASR